jgi:hypothetical protein
MSIMIILLTKFLFCSALFAIISLMFKKSEGG